MEFTNEQLKKAYKGLPENIKTAISEIDVFATIKDIAKKNDLTTDKIVAIAEEASFVLFGVKPAKKFDDALREKIGIDEDTAGKIVHEINERIFNKIRKNL